MIVAHMDSGLGNQMLDYAEYLAIRQANPDKEIYIETFYYDLPDDEPGMFAHWNGYELDRIFGINAPMLRDVMSDSSWRRASDTIRQSQYWKMGWRYAPVTISALASEGIVLTDYQKNSTGAVIADQKSKRKPLRQLATSFFHTYPGNRVKTCMRQMMAEQLIAKENALYDMYREYPDNAFTGHSLEFRFKGFGIERIDQELRVAFHFPDFSEPENIKLAQELKDLNAVAIHARRGDMLSVNGYCYRFGYFKRAVQYIKRHVDQPSFYFFTDPGSMDWCRNNAEIFGLDFAKDDVHFVTWNSGDCSYRDMQLMSLCKHNIITESSFGFWGAYLNQNPDKITCSPDPVWLTTHSF